MRHFASPSSARRLASSLSRLPSASPSASLSARAGSSSIASSYSFSASSSSVSSASFSSSPSSSSASSALRRHHHPAAAVGTGATSAASLVTAAAPRRGISTSIVAKQQQQQQATAAASSSSSGSDEAVEKHTFQAETKQLLNIVANALYTDKHVFVRELVSNASDALEKARHRQVAGEALSEPETPLQIRITTDETAGTITIADSGIGMDKQELIDNLGTIARSGSKAFIQKLKESGTAGASDVGAKIIGQFGVGFYSAFMVSDSVSVYTRSATPGAPAWCWTSAGDGSYEIRPATGVERGSKIVIKLKDTCKQFATAATVNEIVTKYSNFVTFPILLNGKQLNTVQAIWVRSRSEVTEEQYTEFYKYKSNDFEPPLFRLHFESDAPIALKALLYVGTSHEEKYGMGRIKSGVDLYSRKVLIEAHSSVIPDWLRFLHGVVDSEDIPLNISRESMQDSALMRRLKSVLTRRVLRFFEAEARRDPTVYNQKFFAEFGMFLKEGAVTDAAYSADIAKLLRFESSALPAGQLTSFDEYISRCPPGQNAIYYLVAPHRGIAEASPYMEAFRGARKGTAAPAADAAGAEPHPDDVEVLFLYSPIDDFVMNNLREFNGRKLTTAETAELDPNALKGAGTAAAAAAAKSDNNAEASPATSEAAAAAGDAAQKLSSQQVEELSAWFVKTLPKRINKVRATNRLRASPAVVTDHESAAIRRMMRLVEQTAGKDSEAVKAEAHMLPRQSLEINPSHPIITRLYNIRETQPELALVVAEQVVDNALIAAGLVDDSRVMLPRLNALVERVLGVATATDSTYTSAETLAAKRHTSAREADERAAVDLSHAMFGDATLAASAAAASNPSSSSTAAAETPSAKA